MSTTGNEFEQPGVNYPDRGDSAVGPALPDYAEPMREDPDDAPVADGSPEPADGTDHHGQDAGRDTLSAGEAQRERGGLGTGQEQSLPAMSQNNASTDDKVEGIVEQTRVDVGGESLERIAEVLHQRLEQSGIDLTDDEIEQLARRASTGGDRS